MLKSIIESYDELNQQVIVAGQQESRLMLQNLCQSVDPVRDIELFVRTRGTGCIIPLRRTFETFSLESTLHNQQKKQQQ